MNRLIVYRSMAAVSHLKIQLLTFVVHFTLRINSCHFERTNFRTCPIFWYEYSVGRKSAAATFATRSSGRKLSFSPWENYPRRTVRTSDEFLATGVNGNFSFRSVGRSYVRVTFPSEPVGRIILKSGVQTVGRAERVGAREN